MPGRERRAALGLRAHSGWTAAILVCGSVDDVDVVERRRIELCDPAIEGSKQPFHHAEPMAFARAEAFLGRCRKSTEALAASALAALIDCAGEHKLKLVGCGVLSASGRALPSLKEILASHALIHAAEGEFYRDALAQAATRAKLPVTRIREREALRQAADQLRRPEAKLKEKLASLGKSLGPPWTEDQKLATLAAWILLA
jgi:hypothetical protein